MTGLAYTKSAGGRPRIMSTMSGLRHHRTMYLEQKFKAVFYFQVM